MSAITQRSRHQPIYHQRAHDDVVVCLRCGDDYPKRRLELGYDHCLSCSDVKPHKANVCLHKQAYSYSHNPDVIKENQYSSHK